MERYPLQGIALPSIPEDVTIPQFMFETEHQLRPARRNGVPWVIQDRTGKSFVETELRLRTEALSRGLKSRYNIRENEVVLLYSRNHIDFPITIWAVHRLGGVVSGANPDFVANELLHQVKETKPTLIVAQPDSLTIALEVAKEVGLSSERIALFDADGGSEDAHGNYETIDRLVKLGFESRLNFTERILKPGEAKTKLAFLAFSSGTTGRPKAVAISHYSVVANIIQMAAHNKVNQNYCDWKDQRYRPGDIASAVLPFFHMYGLIVNLHYLLFCGMSIVVVPKFNFVEFLKSIERHRISHLLLVPPQVVLLCKHPVVKNHNFRKHIRMILCGAAPLSHELNQQLFDIFPDAHIGQGHGTTETATVTTMWPVTQKRGVPGSSGQLLPGIVARVIKSDGSLAGYDEPGELVIKTPSAAVGYLNNADATKETFVDDGWVKTGDLVKIAEDGEMIVIDRLKEFMKVKGFQVAPAELEGCILDHPDVSNTCVVGIPEEYSGEVPLAFVTLTADASKKADQSKEASEEIKKSIMNHVARSKAHYKHLSGGVVFVPDIPTTPSGKLLRRVLRDKANELRAVKARL